MSRPSAGQMAHLAARALAERLGQTPVRFPGDHQGFATHPGPFAETVRRALCGSCHGARRNCRYSAGHLPGGPRSIAPT